MSLFTDLARICGNPKIGGSTSGLSMEAMLTKVATASSAEGGQPMTWSPQGSSLDSISMSFLYTDPTTVSLSSSVISLASHSGSATSLSRLHWMALSTMLFTMAIPRFEDFRPW